MHQLGSRFLKGKQAHNSGLNPADCHTLNATSLILCNKLSLWWYWARVKTFERWQNLAEFCDISSWHIKRTYQQRGNFCTKEKSVREVSCFFTFDVNAKGDNCVSVRISGHVCVCVCVGGWLQLGWNTAGQQLASLKSIFAWMWSYLCVGVSVCIYVNETDFILKKRPLRTSTTPAAYQRNKFSLYQWMPI